MENAERVEQCRWPEHGYKIKTAETELENLGIDPPADLEHAKLFVV